MLELVERDRQVAHADARHVIDGVGIAAAIPTMPTVVRHIGQRRTQANRREYLFAALGFAARC